MRNLLGPGLLVAALVTFSCGGEVNSPIDSSTGGGSSSCAAFQGDAPQPVKLRIENHTAASIFIEDDCYLSDLDGMRVDGEWVVDSYFTYSCDDALACKEQALDCFGGPDYELAAGATYEATWDGRLVNVTGDSIALPKACTSECVGNDGFRCHRATAAAPGSHTFTVRYAKAISAGYQSLDVPFTMPATTVTAIIDP